MDHLINSIKKEMQEKRAKWLMCFNNNIFILIEFFYTFLKICGGMFAVWVMPDSLRYGEPNI